MSVKAMVFVSVVGFSLSAITSVDAALIQTGLYQLANHPDANQNPPPYGLRLDELSDVTAGNDVFTMSFDSAGTDMKLSYDGSTIRIFGTAFGGRDIGTGYANDAFLGFYAIDFTFSVGVGLVPGDDDVFVGAPTNSNFGTVTLPSGQVISLFDKATSGIPGGTFRLGDEDNDLGHRGFPGISGWGWVDIVGDSNTGATRDWIFTATYIPAPAPVVMFGALGSLLGMRRRRAS